MGIRDKEEALLRIDIQVFFFCVLGDATKLWYKNR